MAPQVWGGPINHVNIVKACMNRITLLDHILAEFKRKWKTIYEISLTNVL